MKKFLAILLAALLCLSVFTACNNNSGNETEETTVGDEEVTYDVESAVAYLKNMYKDFISNPTKAADYELTSQVMVKGAVYTVTWATNSEKVTVNVDAANNKVVVDVDEKTSEAFEYELTATVTAPDGTTGTLTFKLNVPKYELVSFEDYMAAAEGTTVVIEGIVVAMNGKSVGNSRNHLFLADADGKGGYYCYQLDTDPVEAGVKIGMTVSVTAVVTPYNGMQETKGGTFTIVDETIKEVPVLDLTEQFAAGESLKNYVGLVVTFKGVEIGGQDMTKDSSQYLYFSIGDNQGYVRTYVTDFPTTLPIVTEDGKTSSPAKDAIDADHAAHFGYKADVTGILVLYSGKPYLIPVSETPFVNYEEVIKTPAEKVEAELGALTIGASVSADTVIDLIATGKYYSDVTLTWATDDATGAAVIADGKLTLTVPDAETVVKVTVTATCEGVTETKTFSIKLSKTITSIKDAMEIGGAKDHNTYTDEKYLIAGIIKEVYNTTYGNMYIVDELGNEFTVYGTYINGAKYGDAEGAKPQAGDYVVLSGVLGQYNGTVQMKNGDIMSFTTPTTIPGVLESVKDFEKNQYTDNKVIISGEITEVQNATYGNVMIKDADGNSILVYGLYSANGATRYDAMATKPAVGDTITVLGIVGKYNDAQMKNGWLIGFTAAAGGEEETTDAEETTVVDETTVENETTPEEETTASAGTTDPALTTTEITRDNLFAGLTGTSYATYNGTHTLAGYTITTSDVLGNSHGVDSVLQFRKETGTLTVKNISVSSITIVVVSSYNYTGHYVGVKMNGTDLTVPSVSTVAATKAPTGLNNDNGYEVSRYTVTITLDETVTGDLTIYNCTTYAGYVESITINPAN